jgi:uncharacterized membrane protein/protein-disulfide isomerase
MVRKEMETAPPLSRGRVAALTGFAVLGLAASASSTWVHYQLLKNPAYSSFCDVSASVSCGEAYTSPFGSFAGVPVALFGVLFFVLVIGLISLCTRSESASPNLAGYIFALSSAGLAVVLYLAYASFVVLKAVCLLCVGTYIAIIGLFLLSGAATGYPMTSLPKRAARDFGTLLRTPAALSATLAFVAAGLAAILMFPSESVTAAAADTPAAASPQAAPSTPEMSATQLQQLEQYLAQQPRVPIMAPSDGAAVVIVKFNDYQCPPCRQTFNEYKSVFAKWAKDAPGKVKYMTRDYPLERQCNQFVPQDLHPAACEAAVAVRLAREKGKAEAMEEWIFANQPSLTPELVKQGVRTVAGVTDFDTRFDTTLQLVKADIAMGSQLKVSGTPTFFMNGIRLPGLRAEFLDAAIAWELKRVQADK